LGEFLQKTWYIPDLLPKKIRQVCLEKKAASSYLFQSVVERCSVNTVMRRFLQGAVLLTIALSWPARSWTGWMALTDNYFEGTGTNHAVVIQMNTDFHSCGWNNAGQINLNVVGTDAFKSLTAVILSAWISEKMIDVAVDGCAGDRARVVGLKISH
jgi:hypothetical protein